MLAFGGAYIVKIWTIIFHQLGMSQKKRGRQVFAPLKSNTDTQNSHVWKEMHFPRPIIFWYVRFRWCFSFFFFCLQMQLGIHETIRGCDLGIWPRPFFKSDGSYGPTVDLLVQNQRSLKLRGVFQHESWKPIGFMVWYVYHTLILWVTNPNHCYLREIPQTENCHIFVLSDNPKNGSHLMTPVQPSKLICQLFDEKLYAFCWCSKRKLW